MIKTQIDTPYPRAVFKLSFEKSIIKIRRFEKLMYGATLASALILISLIHGC